MTSAPLITPLKKGPVNAAVSVGEETTKERRPLKGRKLRRDRRKNKRDRRKEVRDGMVVLLSSIKDRRTRRDRRQG